MWLWLLVVTVLVVGDLLLAPKPGRADHHPGPDRRRCGSATPPSRSCWSPNSGTRRVRALVRDAWQPTAGASGNRHRIDVSPGDRTLLRTPLRPRRRGDLKALGVTVRRAGRWAGGPAADVRRAGRGPVAAAVRVPQAPAEPAGPAARARRPGRDPGARPGDGVRLAARVRPRRRRPLDRLAGQRPQPRGRRTHLAAGARPPGGAGARHLAHLGGPGRGRAPAGLGDGRGAAAGGAGRPGRRPDRLRRRRPAGAVAAALRAGPATWPRTCRTRWPTSSR